MDLRQLNYFLKIAERRNMTLAAAELHVTQPTLTKSIKLLERELGVPLFQRLPRGMELTEFGRRLVRHALAMQVQVGDALGELESLKNGAGAPVNVGAGPAWQRSHLPTAAARAMAANPNIRLRVTGGFDAALMRALRQGDLDFVVAELPQEDAAGDLALEKLTSDRLVVFCRAGHPLTRLERPGLEETLRFPWVLPVVRVTRARRRLEALFVAHNLAPPEATVEADSMTFLLAMVRETDALSYTNRETLETPPGRGLAVLDIDLLTAERAAGIWTRRNAWLSPEAQAIMAALREVCRERPSN
ncbi:MAG TPA: LysR family transcriptional regulator [Geminicoccus sp.]|uniref:LysR family transcriptional regulator n=1 Tax=Geminicoccus sp. TaxID=2024832 RepID=UPI002CF2BD57|nr:LysR family transcriptional regulator [Geminicoccus sp.]HWL68756.1 LysR family transcriptional regulator [Geminicoccus sp.]